MHFAHASFRELGRVLRELTIDAVDAVLLDLGVSSPQLDDARAASASATPPPPRRRSTCAWTRAQPRHAAALLAQASADELAGWFRDYADLPGARRLARAIVETRARAPLRSAEDLLAVIRASGVGRGRSITRPRWCSRRCASP